MNAITKLPAMPELSTFMFDGHEVRFATLEDGPRFIAKDLCTALKLSNPTVSLKALDPDERSKLFLGPHGEVNVVTEGGMYALIMRCQKALTQGSTAWRFRKKVTTEILPEIRRTGSYGAPVPQPVDPLAFLSNPHNVMQLVAQYAQRTIELEGVVGEKAQALAIAHHTIEEQAPAVEALDRLSDTGGGTCVSNTAKRLGVKPGRLFEYMRNPNARVRWLIKRSAASDDVAYQDRLDAGELATPVEKVTVRPHGEEPRTKLVDRLYVTPTGLVRLAKLLVEAKDPLLPKPVDLVHLVRLSRGDMTSRPREGNPGLFD